MAQANGTIVQSIGAVIDIEFPREGMPKVYDALKLGPDGTGPAYGSSLAAPFAAGLAATALSSGVPPEQLRHHIRQRWGKALHASSR